MSSNPYQVPYVFVPESGQTIRSVEADANFQYLTDALNQLRAMVGTGSGNQTIDAKYTYTQRPQYGGPSTAAPATADFVDLKYMNATRGCRIGDYILSMNPTAMPTDYNVVWAKMEGQQLSKTTYPDFYTVCQSVKITGGYDPDAGSPTTGNFFAPDWRGLPAYSLLGSGGNLPSTVPSSANANSPASVVGETTHKLTVAELASHTHGIKYSLGAASGANNGEIHQVNAPNTFVSDAAGGDTPHNIVQKGFMSLFWVRIK